MFPRLLLATALVIGLPTWLCAQYNVRQRANARQPAAQPQATKIEGTVHGVMRGLIAVLDNENHAWQVAIPPRAQVEVTGSATADYLQAGQIIELKAEVDDHGAIKEKVGALTIVSLSPERQLGLFPPESEGKSGGSDDIVGFGGGGAGGRGVKPVKSVKPAKPAKHATKGSSGTVAAGSYRIVGKLMIDRSGKFKLQTGRGNLTFELADKATVGIDFDDYTAATKDSKITIEGFTIPGRSGMAQAQEVKIELVDALVAAKKKGAAGKSDTKRSAKHPKKDEGVPEPAAEKAEK